MNEIKEVGWKLVSLVLLPVYVVGWTLWGCVHGLTVWCWNFNHKECGEWEFDIPKADGRPK